MATVEQINRFFPKAAGIDEHAGKVTMLEIPANDLMLTTNGTPVLWIKAKKKADGDVICIYTTIGADLSFTINHSDGDEKIE